MELPKTEFEPGDVIAGRYQVQRILGRGGMGMVYLVDDMVDKRPLALKTLLPQYLNHQLAVKRFVREVNAVRRMNHPSIVRIYDAQRTESLIFYTMDFIEGRSVRAWMRQRGKIGLNSTVRIMALLAEALEYAHQFTIHRDISPENVMVLADGSIRLLDFGLAKLSDNQGAFTRIGVSLGKDQYNSPEQRASAADVDCRTDIFSLGIMFYEMLTGELPAMGRPLSGLVPGLPQEYDLFFDRATATLREQRYPNAREFRRDLLRIYQLVKEQPAGGTATVQPATLAPAGPAAYQPGQVDPRPTAIAVESLGFFGQLRARLSNLFRRRRT